MLNINSEKLAYENEFIQARLNAFLVFGLFCPVCNCELPIEFLEFEHLYTAKENKTAVYVCCTNHNKVKNDAEPKKWYSANGLSDVFTRIENSLNTFASISQIERDNAFIEYIGIVFDYAKKIGNVLPDGIARIIAKPQPRRLLSGIDFTGVRVNRKQVTANSLDKYFDLRNAILIENVN